MIRLLFLLACAAGAASAQDAAMPISAESERMHTFEVRDGQIYLDGRHLPDAVPAHLDLAGVATAPLEFSGPITPVLEIDGRAYVLEDERLVPLDQSSRAGNSIYILDDSAPSPESMPRERVQPIIEAAYMRDVADADQRLYNQMRREADLEVEVSSLAARLRRLPGGDERDRLRAELRQQISDLLSLKHDIREQEIDLAARRLDAARLGLEERRSFHDAIVDQRLRELVGE